MSMSCRDFVLQANQLASKYTCLTHFPLTWSKSSAKLFPTPINKLTSFIIVSFFGPGVIFVGSSTAVLSISYYASRYSIEANKIPIDNILFTLFFWTIGVLLSCLNFTYFVHRNEMCEFVNSVRALSQKTENFDIINVTSVIQWIALVTRGSKIGFVDGLLIVVSWSILNSPICFLGAIYFEMDPISILVKLTAHKNMSRMTLLKQIFAKVLIAFVWLIVLYEALRPIRMTFVCMIQCLADIRENLKLQHRSLQQSWNSSHVVRQYNKLYIAVMISNPATSLIACLLMGIGLILQMLCWSLLISWQAASTFILFMILVTLASCMVSLLIALPYAVFCYDFSAYLLYKFRLRIETGMILNRILRTKLRAFLPISFKVFSITKLNREAETLYVGTVIVYALNLIIVMKDTIT